mmetsp:Transcript_102156/g.288536  ORF Transcript_102156/g.288536 Transcript_102156/m.288536 type:complete len:205 (-) Transcript_102156:53-667(-)
MDIHCSMCCPVLCIRRCRGHPLWHPRSFLLVLGAAGLRKNVAVLRFVRWCDVRLLHAHRLVHASHRLHARARDRYPEVAGRLDRTEGHHHHGGAASFLRPVGGVLLHVSVHHDRDCYCPAAAWYHPRVFHLWTLPFAVERRLERGGPERVQVDRWRRRFALWWWRLWKLQRKWQQGRSPHDRSRPTARIVRWGRPAPRFQLMEN